MGPIEHDEAAHRFTARLDGVSARLDYEVDGGVMSITHTHVPKEHRGRGVAAGLMRVALEYAERHHLNVNPVCSYAVAYMQRQAVDVQRHQEAMLDEALDESFPASDPPAVGGVS